MRLFSLGGSKPSAEKLLVAQGRAGALVSEELGLNLDSAISFFFHVYLLIWLCQVLVIAHQIFDLFCRIFSCSMWDVVPRTGIEPRSPAFGVWSLNHWTIWEVPLPFLTVCP